MKHKKIGWNMRFSPKLKTTETTKKVYSINSRYVIPRDGASPIHKPEQSVRCCGEAIVLDPVDKDSFLCNLDIYYNKGEYINEHLLLVASHTKTIGNYIDNKSNVSDYTYSFVGKLDII